jgi:hypothetical protein
MVRVNENSHCHSGFPGLKLVCLVVSIYFISQYWAFAQVVNDNISRRSQLFLDSASINSSTNESTVEWQCINKALTNKCLIYHNDQWFTFNVASIGTYYLNISSQNCRDSRGIQLIVIEGNPCKVETYKILHCIPRLTQQDLFIELKELRADVQYLVNIDGFMGDYCNFDIQLSSHPKGLSRFARNLDTLKLSSSIVKNLVTLQWTLPPTYDDKTDAFEIYRREKGGARNKLVGTVRAEFNALGIAQPHYAFVDTLLSQNTYTYEIFGVLNDGIKEILDQHAISFYAGNKTNAQTLDITLD